MAERLDFKLLRAAEVAEMVGCSASTIWRWTSEREFPQPIRLGGSTRWVSTEVEQHIVRAKSAR